MKVSLLPPEVATAPVMARTTGTFFVAGGFAAGAIGATAGTRHLDRAAVIGSLALLAVVTGLVVLRVGRFLPRWAYHPLVVLGTSMITVAVWVCPGSGQAGVLAAVYTFISVDVFFFFAWPMATAQLLAMLAAAGWALSTHGIPFGPVVALGCVVLALSLVVGPLVARASSAGQDSLTGLANRRALDDALADALAVAARTGEPLSVALVDVDHFKAVNDVHGHAAGDALLCAIARDYTRGLPEGALLARQGGDEFTLLLPSLSGAQALEVTEAVRRTGPTGASCGVAEWLPGESAADVLRRADAALYEAKRAGRGRSALGRPDDHRLQQDLAAAIAAGELTVSFQTIVALPGHAAVGVEALARWTHPERGPVPPEAFIQAAETAGLIEDLGRLVLLTACRGAVALSAAWQQRLLLSVNVSGRELTAPGYADSVLAALAETGWPAGDLILEVTESLLEAAGTSAARSALEALRARGVAVAIDDFGTGYSSFSRLDTLPADYLKLDHSFVSTITTSPRRAGMLEALLRLSRTLDLQVIAEGVESQEQADLLTRLGCRLVQGYLYCRPQPVAVLAAAAPTTVVPPADPVPGAPRPRSAADLAVPG